MADDINANDLRSFVEAVRGMSSAGRTISDSLRQFSSLTSHQQSGLASAYQKESGSNSLNNLESWLTNKIGSGGDVGRGTRQLLKTYQEHISNSSNGLPQMGSSLEDQVSVPDAQGLSDEDKKRFYSPGRLWQQYQQGSAAGVDRGQLVNQASAGLNEYFGASVNTANEKTKGIQDVGALVQKAAGPGKISDTIGTGVTAARAAAGDPTAIAELAQKGIEKVGDIGKKAAGVFTEDKGTKALSSGFGAVGDMGDLTMNPLMSAAGKLGEAFFGTIDKVQEFSDHLLKANLQFAEFSGAMSSIAAEQQVREIERSGKRGDRLAESAGHLAESKSNLDDKMAAVEDVLTIMKNELMSKVIDLLTGIYTVLGGKVVDLMLDMIKGDDDTVGDAQKWLDETVERGEEQWKKQGRPGRFAGQ